MKTVINWRLSNHSMYVQTCIYLHMTNTQEVRNSMAVFFLRYLFLTSQEKNLCGVVVKLNVTLRVSNKDTKGDRYTYVGGHCQKSFHLPWQQESF